MPITALNDIIGQDVPIRILENALRTGHIGHAYLFAGESGVGKELVARLLGRTLNCTAQGIEPCGVCQSCLLDQTDNHPDVFFVTPSPNSIRIEQVRNLVRELAHKPYIGPYRIAILRDADRLTLDAANALLKTLEEPPDFCCLLLLTTNPQALPTTILSRCQVLHFGRSSYGELRTYLLQEHHTSREQADQIARLAQGIPGQAVDMVKDSLWLTSRASALEWLHRLESGGRMEIASLAEVLVGKEPDQVIQWWMAFYRDILVLSITAKPERVINSELTEELEKRVSVLRIQTIFHRLQALQAALRQMKQNANMRLVLEVLFLHLLEE